MQDESHFQGACLQVVADLSPRERRKTGSRLVFNDDLVINHHIQPLFRQWFSLVRNCHDYFSSDGMTAFHQFSLERQRVDELQEAEAKAVVDFIKRPMIPAVVRRSSS